MPKNNIIFLIRAYNEATRILTVIDEIFQAGYHQILVVDDGSSDDTPEILQEYIDSGKIHYLRHVINRGGGAALETGFEYIRRNASEQDWEYVVTFDADGQMDIADMQKFIASFEEDSELDVVIGSRVLEGSIIEHMPWYRKMIVLVGWPLFTRIISGRTPSDPHNGYRMLRVYVLNKIRLTMDGFEYSSELVDEIAMGWFHWKDVPVRIRYDAYTLGKWQKASNALNIAFRMIFKKFF